jgi:hypothetical protein
VRGVSVSGFFEHRQRRSKAAPPGSAADDLHGIRARGKRKFVVTTDSKHGLPVAENLLARDGLHAPGAASSRANAPLGSTLAGLRRG